MNLLSTKKQNKVLKFGFGFLPVVMVASLFLTLPDMAMKNHAISAAYTSAIASPEVIKQYIQSYSSGGADCGTNPWVWPTAMESPNPGDWTIKNDNATCTYQISLGSYKVYDTFYAIRTQTFYATTNATIAPGQTLTLHVDVPSCAYQSDLFIGPTPTDTEDYTAYSRGWQAGKVYNINNLCGQTQQLVCAPQSQSGDINQTFNFTATGGTGTYSWSAPGGATASGSGSSFATSYSTSGSKQVTVSSNGQTATCAVTINTAPAPLVCAPANQSITPGQVASFSATGGNGGYNWTSTTGKTGRGTTFSDNYTQSGSATVRSTDGQTATCNVTVASTQKSFTVVAANFCVGTNTVYTFNASANLANQTIYFSTVSSPIGTEATSTVGTLNGNAAATITGRAWTTADIGHWKRVFTVDSISQILEFDVRDCSTRPALVCAPQNQGGLANQTFNFTATGGTGTYSWSAPGGATASGSGSSFNTSYAASGDKLVTVTSGAESATCNVHVAPVVYPNLQCVPPTQTANLSQEVWFSATGGNGSYTWTATGSGNASGSGQSFSTNYSSTGSKTVTVRSADGQTASCAVTIISNPPPSLICTPPSQTANVNQTVYFSALGGTAPYNWTLNGGSQASGSGSSVSTSYASAGTYTARVTSQDGQTANCSVTINQNNTYGYLTITKVVRNVSSGGTFSKTANASSGERVAYQITVMAQNGAVNGVYLTDILPSGISFINGSVKIDNNSTNDGSVNNLSLGNLYSGQSKTVYFEAYASAPSGQCQSSLVNTATAAGQNTGNVSDSATVTINQNCNTTPQLVCTPNSQTANINQTVSFSASGGNGSYSWFAASGSPSAGTGSSFSSSFNSSGTRTITVTSAGMTANCMVNVNQAPGNPNLAMSKSAINNTKSTGSNQVDATKVNASKEDFITYTLTVRNTGGADAQNFVITDDLSQVLPFADITDKGGGTVSGNVITFPGMNIQQGGSVSKSFTVRVKYFLADNISYTMTNTYGNTVVIHINTPQVQGAFIAPKTGAQTGGIVFAVMMTLAFGIAKKRKNLMNLVLG